MKVLVAGKGFIGNKIEEMLSERHEVKYLDRNGADHEHDITEVFEIEEKFDTVIHCIGLAPGMYSRKQYQEVHVKGTQNLLDAVEADRWIYFSALGVGEVSHSFFTTKEEAEKMIRDQAAEHVFIRPSTVIGEGNRLLELIKTFSVLRVFPNVKTEVQPIRSDDLVEAVVETVEDGYTGTLNAAGPEKMTVGEMAQGLFRQKGRRCLLLPAPMPVMKAGVLAGSVLPGFPQENVELLEQSNSTDENHVSELVELSSPFPEQ